MKIRMKIQVSGTRDGQPWPRQGEVIEVADEEGAQMCSAGLADPVAERPVETATPPVEDVEKRAPDKPAEQATPAKATTRRRKL